MKTADKSSSTFYHHINDVITDFDLLEPYLQKSSLDIIVIGTNGYYHTGRFDEKTICTKYKNYHINFSIKHKEIRYISVFGDKMNEVDKFEKALVLSQILNEPEKYFKQEATNDIINI